MDPLIQAFAGLFEGLINPIFGSLNSGLNQAFAVIDGLYALKPFTMQGVLT